MGYIAAMKMDSKHFTILEMSALIQIKLSEACLFYTSYYNHDNPHV